jgi:hypothetical protein
MEKYLYFEKTGNLPGFEPNEFIYNLVLAMLNITKTVNPKASNLIPIVERTIYDYKKIYERINKSKIYEYDASGNKIPVKDSSGKQEINEIGEPVYKGETITYQNYAAKKLASTFFAKLFPTFVYFLQTIEERNYVVESFKNNKLVKIIGILNQMYAKQDDELDKLMSKLDNISDNIEVSMRYFDRDYIQNGTYKYDDDNGVTHVRHVHQDVVNLISELFDRKSSKALHPDKKMYNEGFRLFLKLGEYSEKISEQDGVLPKLTEEEIKYLYDNKKLGTKLSKLSLDELKKKGLERIDLNDDEYADYAIANQEEINEIRRQIQLKQTQLSNTDDLAQKNQLKLEINKLMNQFKESFVSPEIDNLQVAERVAHTGNRGQNFQLPGFMSPILQIGGKTAYRTKSREVQKDIVDIGAIKGVDTTSVKENREFFGRTRVFNDFMKKIIKQRKKGILKAYNDSNDRVKANLTKYFTRQSPFFAEYNKIYPEASPKRLFWFNYKGDNFWYNPEDPHNQNLHFFKREEALLIDSILKNRNISVGAEGAYDLDLVYNDFIYLLRIILNGNLKNTEGKEVTFIQAAENDGKLINKLVSNYVKENDAGIKDLTSGLYQDFTSKIGAKKRSEAREIQKQEGKIPFSKSEERKRERQIDLLLNKFEILGDKESQEITRALTLDKMEDNPSFYKDEKAEILDFFINNVKIIKIKKSQNLLSPKISNKPTTDSEMRSILSKILKKKSNEVTQRDFEIAREIFNSDSNSYFNRQSFMFDYINMIKNDLTKIEAKITSITVPDATFKKPDINDKQRITDFLKKMISSKLKVTDREIEIAKTAFNQDENDVISRELFRALYNYYDEKNTLDIEIEKLDEFKKLKEKEILIGDILSPLSTNAYSNILYLQMTDLRKEIKFSHKKTDLVMQLKPSNDSDPNSGGVFTIGINKDSLSDFLSLNEYLIDEKEISPLTGQKLYLENINVDDFIKLIKGTYDVEFKKSSSELSIDDISDIYDKQRITALELKAGQKIEDIKQEISNIQKQKSETLRSIANARLRHRKFDDRLNVLSGKGLDAKIEDDFYIKANTFLTHLKEFKNTKMINFDLSELQKIIDEYKKTINFEKGVTGSEAIRKSAKEVKVEFAKVFNSINPKKGELINKYMIDIFNTIKTRKIKFLQYKSNPTDGTNKFVFSSSLYGGSLEDSYLKLISTFNKSFNEYINFKFTPKPSYIELFNELRLQSETFIQIIDSLEQIFNLIKNDNTMLGEGFNKYEYRNKKLYSIEENFNEKEYIPLKMTRLYNENYESFLVEEKNSKYKKVEYSKMKPNKFTILHEITKSNEIK